MVKAKNLKRSRVLLYECISKGSICLGVGLIFFQIGTTFKGHPSLGTQRDFFCDLITVWSLQLSKLLLPLTSLVLIWRMFPNQTPAQNLLPRDSICVKVKVSIRPQRVVLRRQIGKTYHKTSGNRSTVLEMPILLSLPVLFPKLSHKYM